MLFITGYAENAVVGNGHLEPGMHVLTKPFPLDSLTRRIQEILPGLILCNVRRLTPPVRPSPADSRCQELPDQRRGLATV